ncbi:hypothetical protein P3573_24650 [Vibrio parahaemolyticus]|nr:hypothetical protein [Vibrio parahaemolyticus]
MLSPRSRESARQTGLQPYQPTAAFTPGAVVLTPETWSWGAAEVSWDPR